VNYCWSKDTTDLCGEILKSTQNYTSISY